MSRSLETNDLFISEEFINAGLSYEELIIYAILLRSANTDGDIVTSHTAIYNHSPYGQLKTRRFFDLLVEKRFVSIIIDKPGDLVLTIPGKYIKLFRKYTTHEA